VLEHPAGGDVDVTTTARSCGIDDQRYGLDTDFLVACEIVDHPFHQSADALPQKLLADEHDFALAPQTLAEFIHIVTDMRRTWEG